MITSLNERDMLMKDTFDFSDLNLEQNTLNLDIQFRGITKMGTEWSFQKVTSQFDRLYFIIDAEAYLENEQGSCVLRPGYMYLIPAYSCHNFVCTKSIYKYCIHFNIELIAGLDLLGLLYHSVQELPYSQELLDQLLVVEKSTSLKDIIHLRAMLWQVVYKFIAEVAYDTDYEGVVNGFMRQANVLQYVSTHLNATLRIQDIASALNITARQLSRTFQQDTGRSLKKHIEQMLIQKACHLLRNTSLSICQISNDLGFSDPYYFSRFFKKRMNMFPSFYRNKLF